MFIVVKLNQQQSWFSVFTSFTSVKCTILSMGTRNKGKIEFGLRALLVMDFDNMFLLDTEQPNDSFYKMDYMPANMTHAELKELHKKGYQEMFVNTYGPSFDIDDEMILLVEIYHN